MPHAITIYSIKFHITLIARTKLALTSFVFDSNRALLTLQLSY